MTIDRWPVVLLTVLALLPTVLVEIPAMGDYPNHLARMYLVADVGTRNENPYYEVVFALYPNLAMDLVVPQLAKVMEVESATRWFFFFSQVLIVSGAIAIEWVVKGRHEISGYMALLALQSTPFSHGFVNFEFGMGLALFGIASWIGFRNRSWQVRFAIHVVFVVALFLAHFFALGVYGLALALYELHRMASGQFDVRRATAVVAILASPVLVLLAVLYLTGGAIGGKENEWLFSWKPVWVALFLNGYDVYLSAGSMAALAVLAGYLFVRGDLAMSRVGLWIGAGFLFVFFLMPFRLFEARMTDIRVLSAIFLIVPAFVSFRGSKQSAFVPATVLCGLILLNTGYTASVWLSYRRDYADVKASFALLKPTSFVLIGNSHVEAVGPTLLTDLPMHRAPVLAVHYARSFVSGLYTVTGAQPVEVRPAWRHLDVNSAVENYHPPILGTLRAVADGQAVPQAPSYLRNWTRDFDYVYLVGPNTEDALPGVLKELARSRRFTLYAVRKP